MTKKNPLVRIILLLLEMPSRKKFRPLFPAPKRRLTWKLRQHLASADVDQEIPSSVAVTWCISFLETPPSSPRFLASSPLLHLRPAPPVPLNPRLASFPTSLQTLPLLQNRLRLIVFLLGSCELLGFSTAEEGEGSFVAANMALAKAQALIQENPLMVFRWVCFCCCSFRREQVFLGFLGRTCHAFCSLFVLKFLGLSLLQLVASSLNWHMC